MGLTEMERKALDKRRGQVDEARQGSEPQTGELVDFAAEGGMPVPPPPEYEPEVSPVPEKPRADSVVMNGQISAKDLADFGRAAAGAPPALEPEPEEEVTPKPKEAEMSTMPPPTCPKCGWERGKALKVEPTEADRREFVRSALGERRFRKKYPFFDGQVLVTLRSALRGETQALSEVLTKDIDEQRLLSPQEWHTRRRELMLSIILESVDVAGKLQEFPEIGGCKLEEEQARRSLEASMAARAGWPESIVGMVIYAQMEFEDLHQTLVARTYDADFWRGLTDSKA